MAGVRPRLLGSAGLLVAVLATVGPADGSSVVAMGLRPADPGPTAEPAAAAATTSQSVTAVADSYVSADAPSTAYGRQTSLRTDGEPVIRSYLRFDTSGLSTITKATLQVYAESASSVGIAVHQVADTTWPETTMTYATAPPVGTRVTTSGRITASTWVTIDVTSGVHAAGLTSLALLGLNTQAIKLSARETTTRPPTLVLEGAPSAPGDPVLVAAGDIACDPASSGFNGGAGTTSSCHMRATAELVKASGADAVAALGDTQYETGTAAQYAGSYDPTWGVFRASTYPATGNHEYTTAGAAGYYGYFGSRAGDPSTGWYSYELGTWHVIVLNSNCSKIGGCGVGSPQDTWLRNDLAAHPTACTLAYWHHPHFSSGTHGDSVDNRLSTPFWTLLRAAGADVVLNGHDHDYERFAKQDTAGNADAVGIREFVVGTGGKSHSGVVTLKPNSEVRNNDTFGVLKLTLHPGGYDWTFVHEPGKTFTDSGSDTCV